MTLEILHFAVAAILIVAAFMDARFGRIPNWTAYGLLGLFAVQAFMFSESVDLYWQIGIAAGVFLGGLVLFAVGAIGAGAIKLGSATMLFMPLAQWGWLLAIFIGSVFGYMIIFVLVRTIFGSEESTWSVLKKRVVPMAWPIGTMGLVGLFGF